MMFNIDVRQIISDIGVGGLGNDELFRFNTFSRSIYVVFVFVTTSVLGSKPDLPSEGL